MKIKHQEIVPNPDKPFDGCKLGREPYARILTDIVNTYAEGFVLAINNEWGTGKTTFVKMWQQQLENEEFKTIYFNAWENDFDTNPLVAIMSELKTLTREENKEAFNSILKKGAVLVKNVVPALAKSLLKSYVGEIAVEAIENATKASAEILEEEINEYAAKKQTIVEFRKELEKFVKNSDKEKPLVFIVDELDRCRPNYAVEVLEQIKHLFSVPGIVFVLSIDKKHLGSSIRGFYGSDLIDSDEYLRRFIDLEYSIPRPSTKNFVNYLFEYYSFKDFFSSNERMKYREFEHDSEKFILMADYLLTNSTLRQQERIFGLTRLVLCSFKVNEYTFSHLLFYLVYLKMMRNDIFQKIERNEFSLQELSDIFYETTYSEKKDKNRVNFKFVESLLLWFYNNDRAYPNKEELLLSDAEGNLTTPINSKIFMESDSLVQRFENFSFKYQFIPLEYLITKINLTEGVK